MTAVAVVPLRAVLPHEPGSGGAPTVVRRDRGLCARHRAWPAGEPSAERDADQGPRFAEYGRIAKTEHLLRVADPVDDTYRRQVNRRLTVQQSRHKLARDVCHGKRGTIHQAYRDGMEDQLGALGLVLDAIVLFYLGRPEAVRYAV